MISLRHGDCLIRMDQMEDGSIDAVVSDPPYDLVGNKFSRNGSNQPGDLATPHGRSGPSNARGFMGKTWDGTGIAFSQHFWSRVFRVVKPGGVVKVFGGTRTFHRMAAAMEQAGFVDISLEAWGYGSGFPKSLSVSKAIDKMKGLKRTAKRIEFTGNALMRHGGDNTRPWMEEALEKGYHELPGDEPACEESKAWNGWGTALKPAWEPVLVGTKPR